MFYWFREKGRDIERERKTLMRERSIDWLPPTVPQMGIKHTIYVWALPDWELNLQPFGAQDDAPTNWATLASVLLWTFNGVNSSSIFRVRKFFGMTRFFSLTFLNVQISHLYCYPYILNPRHSIFNLNYILT